MSDFSALSVGLSGLEAQQAAEDTVGQNVANANTAGYDDESVQLGAVAIDARPLVFAPTGNGPGDGVAVDGVERLTDSYLQSQSYTEQGNQGVLERAAERPPSGPTELPGALRQRYLQPVDPVLAGLVDAGERPFGQLRAGNGRPGRQHPGVFVEPNLVRVEHAQPADGPEHHAHACPGQPGSLSDSVAQPVDRARDRFHEQRRRAGGPA